VSPAAITLIVAAAIAHASWNLLSKQASATGAVFFIWLLAACAAVIYSPVTVLAASLGQPHLTRLNWLFLAGTGVLQSGYFLFLQRGYSLGDLSVVYPIGRGAGAMLAALAGIVLLGERPSPVAITGIVAIGAGVVLIGIPGAARRAASRPAAPARGAIVFALLTGMFIASYTIWDKYAVADLQTPPILQGYACFPVMTAVFAPFVLRDRQRLAEVWRSFRLQVLGAALLAPLAYILVLTALSFTAVSAVAPAREVSVLFGVLLGGRLLGESGLARRLTGAAAIVAGIIAIAVS
jgi:drug/metabolite transporter (DMT)-like permease